MSSVRRVVITGLGVASPLGCDVTAFWEGIAAGKSGIRRIERFDPSALSVHIGGEVPGWDQLSATFFDSKDLKRLDRFSQFALYAAEQAVQQSQIDFSKTDLSRVGVAIGSAIGGLEEIEEQHTRLIQQGPRRVSPFLIPKILANMACGLVSIRYGLRGPTTTVATACASANQSIGDAVRMIRYNLADVMLVGGSEAALVPTAIAGFSRMQALSERNDDPETASRPWDAGRDGFVMAEGGGVLVIETLEHALERGATPLAELIGVGLSSDGYHMTAPHPEGVGAIAAMKLALADAGIQPTDIDYINAHGTSTPLGDRAETEAIKRVFGEHASRLAVSSTKSQIGHLLGASGAVELVACVKALEHQMAPPTINLENPDEGCDLDYVPHRGRWMQLETVLSNSFGFGGHNACLIVRRFDR
jgi:3-oxoacyl-[acyl-carrier-protein] synthase II